MGVLVIQCQFSPSVTAVSLVTSRFRKHRLKSLITFYNVWWQCTVSEYRTISSSNFSIHGLAQCGVPRSTTHNSFHLREWAVLLVAIRDTMTVKGGNRSGRKSFQAASLVVVVARAAGSRVLSNV